MKYGMIGNLLALAVWVLGLAAVPLSAKIVKVYTLNDGTPSFGEMRALAATLRDAPESEGSQGSFGYVVSKEAKLGSSLSVGPGVSAYFWSDRNYAWDPAFLMQGRSLLFEGGNQALGGQASGLKSPISYATALNKVSLTSESLRLHYTLSKPGKVSIVILGVDGKKAASWTLNENSSGPVDRSFRLERGTGQAYFVRWESNGQVVSRKVLRN